MIQPQFVTILDTANVILFSFLLVCKTLLVYCFIFISVLCQIFAQTDWDYKTPLLNIKHTSSGIAYTKPEEKKVEK